MRVASLVPAATEILRFLGLEPVGVSHCCAWPGKPVLTEELLQGVYGRQVRVRQLEGQPVVFLGG